MSSNAADSFCELACLVYDERDHPARRDEAAALLAAEPGLVDLSLWAACAAADREAVLGHLGRGAEADGKGGPFDWEPLLYLTFSRVPQGDAVGTARALLDAGADPNAKYWWQGLEPPFTVLTGVFGEGEQGAGRQPRHPDEQALARLLLDRGALPNDGQALYNRMFRRDDSHLVLLFEYGLGHGDSTEPVAEMMDRQLRWAAERGFESRLRLLADHGWSLDDPSLSRLPALHRAGTADEVRQAVAEGANPNALFDGSTALHEAAFAGDVPLIEALLGAGADPNVVDLVHGTPPLVWAAYACQPEAVAVLEPVTRS